MAEIRWTEESAQWLQDIYEYISADNPDAAEKVISTHVRNTTLPLDSFHIGQGSELYFDSTGVLCVG